MLKTLKLNMIMTSEFNNRANLIKYSDCDVQFEIVTESGVVAKDGQFFC